MVFLESSREKLLLIILKFVSLELIGITRILLVKNKMGFTALLLLSQESQIQKIGLNEVWVPKACYKILFSGAKGTPKMIAFVMNNNALPKGELTQWATTVDNIEKQTGIDFFASMPDDLENKLEGQLDIIGWFAK
jgi:DNA/RNA endonuclease G (NUC1)